jgi:uncharacterized protein YjgD (DUF1641 family)
MGRETDFTGGNIERKLIMEAETQEALEQIKAKQVEHEEIISQLVKLVGHLQEHLLAATKALKQLYLGESDG